MIGKVQKWGNSLGLRIPKAIAQDVKVRPGAAVELSVEGGRLVVTPLKRRKRYDLPSLLEQITPENRHDEVDFGPPAGKEAW